MYLLDTNVLSELRKIEMGRANINVVAWAARTGRTANFLSVITLLEIRIGIHRIEKRDQLQATRLQQWLADVVLPDFKGRILDVNASVAQQAAKLHVPNPRNAHDALIAATAIVHQLTLATRNVADFTDSDVHLVNPWHP